MQKKKHPVRVLFFGIGGGSLLLPIYYSVKHSILSQWSAVINPQRLDAVALAFQVYFRLHFLLLFSEEP